VRTKAQHPGFAVIDEFACSVELPLTRDGLTVFTLIDAKGHVVYKGKPDPFGFKSVELRAALSRLVN
jgi:hypothetical protein